jgi:hypothetical protein
MSEARKRILSGVKSVVVELGTQLLAGKDGRP